ncbi:MAG: hypothetical protein OEZ31_11065, partial [Nitrospirota bacterium]|nr:hypothetical protein [Nitrospirota bacterium]
ISFKRRFLSLHFGGVNDEAMVTTYCKIHSPEIAYLESGRNGIMVEDNVQAFASVAERIFRDDAFRQTLASACIEGSSRYTLEKMVDNFCEGILKALSAEPERTPPTRCQ